MGGIIQVFIFSNEANTVPTYIALGTGIKMSFKTVTNEFSPDTL